jgi:exosome complex component RRP45
MRLPEVELVGDSEVIVHPPEARAPVPLSVNHAPYCLTFGLYTVDTATGASKGKSKTADTSSGRTVAVLDPAGLEEKMAMGTLSVAVNAQKELCVVHKGQHSMALVVV